MTIKNALTRIGLTALLALSSIGSGEAKADSIFKGVRGPTNLQLDQRVSFGERETLPNKTQTTSDNTILKYWSGNQLGAFGFVNVPYKEISKGNASSDGLGDINIGLGPRGKLDFGQYGSLNFLSCAGLTLPTGDNKVKHALGSGRLDNKAGLFTTYLSKNKRLETDASIEYTSTGKDGLGNKPSDELAAGIVAGGQIARNLRLVGGLTGNYKCGGKNEGDYSFGPRANMRYIVSLRTHFEIVADYYSINKDMPRGFGLTAIMRINLGEIHKN
jgi:hypothetical protein